MPNFARYTFLDDDAHRFYPDWDTAADTCVAILRTEAGRDPHDRACTTSSASCPPAARNSAAAGAPTTSDSTAPAPRHFHHHAVGDLDLAYESLDLRAEPGLTLTIYAAEPGSLTAVVVAPGILGGYPTGLRGTARLTAHGPTASGRHARTRAVARCNRGTPITRGGPMTGPDDPFDLARFVTPRTGGSTSTR